MKKIAILGSTGSIGTQTLEVVRANQDIQVCALAAGNNIVRLEQQIREFHPRLAAVWSEEKAKELRIRTADLEVESVSGMEGASTEVLEKFGQALTDLMYGIAQGTRQENKNEAQEQ